MKIAVLCDLHLPRITSASQYHILDWAIENIKSEKPDLTVVAGDICAGGEREAFYNFKNKIEGIPHLFLLGNSDIRDELHRDEFINKFAKSQFINADGYKILGISTPFTYLTDNDKLLLEKCLDGDVIFMHHNPDALEENSRIYINNILSKRTLTLIHGHKHMDMEQNLGKSKIIGVRGLDPDKVYGMPAVTYIDINDKSIKKYNTEFFQDFLKLSDFKENIGIACFHPDTDIDYAIENKIKCIEIELRKEHELDNFELIKNKVEAWRSAGGKFLSVHMPELRFDNNVFTGEELLKRATDMVCILKPENITIHVPRVYLKDMIIDSVIWRKCLFIMYNAIKKLPSSTTVGIENLHMLAGSKNDCNRLFGCVPEECILWADALNSQFGYERCGLTLDVGHASNNSVFHSRYTRSMWYEICGKRINAYHIHQVLKTDKGLSNHNAIENWFGNTISYFSFMWCWQENHINHSPVFLEMKNQENCRISLNSLEKILS